MHKKSVLICPLSEPGGRGVVLRQLQRQTAGEPRALPEMIRDTCRVPITSGRPQVLSANTIQRPRTADSASFQDLQGYVPTSSGGRLIFNSFSKTGNLRDRAMFSGGAYEGRVRGGEQPLPLSLL